MTRVSDRAAFAASVAEGGALPVPRPGPHAGPEVRDLLTETAERLGDRPWGVGILGFVPPEVREAQLEVVHDVAPPVALIAGGRPSQARPLEDAGIATYLHVPSPGLLDRFLKDGARRFVFEGRECGGHVGPRSSFSLWDAQVERLLADDDPSSLHVLLRRRHPRRPLGGHGRHRGRAAGGPGRARRRPDGHRLPLHPGGRGRRRHHPHLPGGGGGVHPHRPAGDGAGPRHPLRGDRLRAGLPGPARGAGGRRRRGPGPLGRAGDAQPGPAAHGLQGADPRRRPPGGAGRRRPAPRRHVHDRRGGHDPPRRVVGRGAPPLGLRGQRRRRRGGHRRAGGPRRRPRGRGPRRSTWPSSAWPRSSPAPPTRTPSGPTSSAGSTASPRSRPSAGTSTPTTTPRPSPGTPAARRRRAGAASSTASASTPSPTASRRPRWPRSSRCSCSASRWRPGPWPTPATPPASSTASGRRSIFGAESGNDLAGAYGFRAFFPQVFGDLPPELEEHLPAYTEDSFPGVLTNVIAGRIANRLDLGGVNYTLDAACASSLAAVDAAAKELVGRHQRPGRLRRRRPAQRSQRLPAVRLGPRPVAHRPVPDLRPRRRRHRPGRGDRRGHPQAPGRRRARRRPHLRRHRRGGRLQRRPPPRPHRPPQGGPAAGRHPCPGPVRPAGRRRSAWSRPTAPARWWATAPSWPPSPSCTPRTGPRPAPASSGRSRARSATPSAPPAWPGSSRPSRAVHHGVLPPTLNVVDPNPYWDPATSPFRLLDAARPWLDDERRAAVSAFGFGGTNFHAVVSAAEPDVAPHGLERVAGRAGPGPRRVARRGPRPHRRAGRPGRPDRRGRPRRPAPPPARRGPHRLHRGRRARCGSRSSPPTWPTWPPGCAPPSRAPSGPAPSSPPAMSTRPRHRLVAFLYPGQGSQRPGMLGDLFVAFPDLREVLRTGRQWVDLMLPAGRLRQGGARRPARGPHRHPGGPAHPRDGRPGDDRACWARWAWPRRWPAATATASWPPWPRPAPSTTPPCST